MKTRILYVLSALLVFSANTLQAQILQRELGQNGLTTSTYRI